MDYLRKRPTAVVDTECYPNYWLIYFRDIDSDRRKYFDLYPGKKLDVEGILELLKRWRIITFNGNGYDLPMIALALAGASCSELKRASDSIIQAGVRPWEFYDFHDVRLPRFIDHIDLMEVAPGKSDDQLRGPGLKIYGGRLHSQRMENLPIEPDDLIKPHERPKIISYCGTDLQVTIDLARELREQIELRAIISNECKVDVRSKSDAQIAEAVIRHEIEKVTNRKIKKPDLEPPGQFYYKPPAFIDFRTPNMQKVLSRVCNIPLVIGRNGRVQKTEAFDKLVFNINDMSYKMGIGGLHSQETSRSLYTTEDEILIDEDVTGYYPKLIINNKLIPPACGYRFHSIFEGIYERRVKAKRAKQKAIAETLKIVLNGTFGKLGQPYSIFYAPRQMITVTLTGQLSLLMAIERLEMRGVSVVSANTDGFTSLVPRYLLDKFHATLFDWECDTGFDLEEVRYRSMHNRSVNGYIAIPFVWDADKKCWDESKIDKPKRKELYAPAGPGLPAAMGLKKNPAAEISTDAVIEYLSHNTPIEETIEKCSDIRRFLSVRTVKGGGVKDDVLLGKAVRWYYGENETGGIVYRESGNMVPKSQGAKPCMDLPTEFPDDIDYGWYIDEAYAILKDLGVKFVDPYYANRKGVSHARLPDKKSIHFVDMSTGRALCGAAPPGPRVRWVEYGRMPEDHRLCGKCRRENSL